MNCGSCTAVTVRTGWTVAAVPQLLYELDELWQLYRSYCTNWTNCGSCTAVTVRPRWTVAAVPQLLYDLDELWQLYRSYCANWMNCGSCTAVTVRPGWTVAPVPQLLYELDELWQLYCSYSTNWMLFGTYTAGIVLTESICMNLFYERNCNLTQFKKNRTAEVLHSFWLNGLTVQWGLELKHYKPLA
jgi:hypothetical protein